MAEAISAQSIDIVYKNITYEYYSRKTKVWVKVLKGVSGEIKAGQCLAVMGASGAGKSTLLNILSGRVVNSRTSRVGGEIFFNGKKYSPKQIASFSGYVLQEDIMNEFLTVNETLSFGARLKVTENQEKRKKRVAGMISEFKLEGTENTYIGGPSIKGISGGERKRVNICLELIADPPILFLDEPTSGLDSYTSWIVIKKLKELAVNQNKTVVYVIHQPSSEIFRKMDQLSLLFKGHIIYSGDSGEKAVSHFEKQGFICDNNTNP